MPGRRSTTCTRSSQVRDDGGGFDPAVSDGSGLANMADRPAAVGWRV
jgi:hypothetical protein